MSFFNFDPKKWFLILVVVTVPLLALNLATGPDKPAWLSGPITWTSSAIQQMYFVFSNEIRGNASHYLDLIGIKQESKDVRKENAVLKAQLLSLGELKLENERLSKLLEFRSRAEMDLLAAKIMSQDLVSDHVTVQINRGLRDGLKAGQAVITVDGVVGYIFRPDTFSSQVLLITDRYAVVDGLIQRSRARGIVEGKSGTKCSLRYVERSEDVVEGDLVVTSGLDNIFPKGFPIAVVSKVQKRNQDVSLRVELEPVVDPRKLEEVFVVLNAANVDFTPGPVPVTQAETEK